MRGSNDYTDELRRLRSLLIVTSLQKRSDLKALELIREYPGELSWEPLNNLLIDPDVWTYAVVTQGYDPRLAFCHPDILRYNPATSLYYRGLCALSLKAAKDYFGDVKRLEEGSRHSVLSDEKALQMARTYNAFICSIIENSTDWTLDNGYRTIVATLGITFDGVMRNRVGNIAEERIRTLILDWVINHGLLVEPPLTQEQVYESVPRDCTLQEGITMRFGSEPDIAFMRDDELLAIVEVKGGIDPAGALERYGAATKSFQHAVHVSPRCRNFYLGAVFTPELERRVSADRLVDKTFDIIRLLEDPKSREEFFSELFHHTLRLS